LRAGDDVCILSQTASKKEMTMWLQEVYQRLVNRPRTRRQTWPQNGRRPRARLGVEQLEDRLTPSNFTAATVSDLIADINAANQAGGPNTITLVAGNTFSLTNVDNTTDGATGLPVIAANDNLTILGNGDTIERSTATGTPAFRLFDVASGAALTLDNLTLQHGLAQAIPRSSAPTAKGGAIYSCGALVLNDVTVQQNRAQGSFSSSGCGGGVFVGAGTADLTGDTFDDNTVGTSSAPGLPGLPAYGAGLCVADGTVTLANNTFDHNNSDFFGGGLAVLGGTVTLTGDTIDYNSCGADGGGLYVSGGSVTLTNEIVEFNNADGKGGGLSIEGGAVSLDAYTVQHILHNTAPAHANIYGSYTIRH
jgi:hypothetical protein